MATEEKLMELLRRAHTVIGEALIDNALDDEEAARKLHNEIGEVFGLAPAPAGDVRCTAKWFVAGGRDERRCHEDADVVCTRCGNGWCEEHAIKIAIYNIDGKPVCEDCLEPSEDRETLEGYEW
jgi:hypothetical protein